MPPTDNIVITHYFLQNHVRNLGAGPAWMIALLRDDVYYNSETGELRDTVWFSGGYQEIADRMGLSRHRTVSEWLPPVFKRTRQRRGKDNARKQRRARTRESVKQFLKIVGHQQNNQGHLSLKFKVNLSEPFTPLDQALYNLSFDIFSAYLSTGSEEFLEEVLDWDTSAKDAIETLKAKIKDAFETLEDANDTSKDAIETLKAKIKDAFETLGDALETQKDVSKTRLRLLKHLINHLQRKHYQLNSPTTTTHANGKVENDGGEEVVVVDKWDFEKLLRVGGLADEKTQWVLRNIASDPAMGKRLVAWCLYGYANKTRDDRQGINAPVLFAVSRYTKAEPNPDYLTLAQKSPDQLLQMTLSFYTPDLTRSQRQILESLRSNGFISMLSLLSAVDSGSRQQDTYP
jgi:Flp pilus assembly pilin Flp